MNKGWEIKSLMEIACVSTGKWDANHATEEGKYRFYTCAAEHLYCDTKRFSDECLILPGNGVNVGKVFYYDGEFDAYQRTYVISDIKILSKYLYYHMLLYWETLGTKQQYGSATNFIKVGNFKDYKIEFPPLPEQHRIVSILDKCFSAIDKAKANAEQNLKNAKELFESYLQGAFENGKENWEIKCLDELGIITSSKRIYKSEYVKDGVPFYRTKEIKEISNGKPITLELFISRERYNEIKKSFGVPKIGDLLLSAVGTIGEIMVIENNTEFYFKDGNIVWFKDFKSLDTNYLKYALTAFVEKVKSLAIGAAYSALTIEKLNKFKISYPNSIEQQQTIVRQLDALQEKTQTLVAVYKKKIADLEELKKSILQRAFAGELTEKIPKG